ncbi:hypothetical protein [Clostridium kluyveri]|uniref:Uncharacterized protein n=1 Tax=Clostridium kluyveri TaxID=1534 RepID=A0A1L5F4B9_CLOKL|nr:hypothetical protein [Clostridium kluyveri]APM37844.1 hypothetical protein BS101_03370 [Clostridium kluyveri]
MAKSIPYKIGELAGDIGSFAFGAAEAGTGAGGELLGFTADGTVVLAPAGVALNAASLGLVTHGGAATIKSAHNFGEDLFSLIKGEGNKGSGNPITNSKGITYPEVTDLKTGEPMEFPDGDLTRAPKNERVDWYKNQSEANLYRENDTDILCKKDFIDEWYNRGYSDPPLNWKEYDIHHITPREFGGDASFENLTPVERGVHQSQVTPWWNAYNK